MRSGVDGYKVCCHVFSDHSDDGSATTVGRTLPLLSHATTPTAPPTEATITNSLLRSHSVDEIHQLSVNPSTSTSRELPCIPRYCTSHTLYGGNFSGVLIFVTFVIGSSEI